MTIPERYVEAVAVAILAVNSYPVARVMKIVPRLRTNTLLTPSYVASLEIGPLTAQLYEAGYDRGMLTWRIAERFHHLMVAIDNGALDALEDLVARNDQIEAVRVLLTLRGVGPKVATAAWALMVEAARVERK